MIIDEKHRKHLSNIVFIYVTIGAINWAPFISPSIINNLKYLFFIFLLFQSYRYPEHGILGPFKKTNFFILILCCIPAIASAKGNIIINLLDFTFIFLTSYIVSSLPLQFSDWYKIFHKIIVFYGFVGLLSVLAQLGFFNFQAPSPWEKSSFANGGLGGYRTGWSNSLFLYVPFGLFYFTKEKKFWRKYLVFISVLLIIYMQFLSGGRAGMLGSFLAVLIILRANKLVYFLVLFFGFLFYSSVGDSFFLETFRMNESLIENKAGVDELDKITSGRTSGYEAAIEAILEEPILGYGFNRNEDILERWDVSIEVHNTYLKRFMEGGVLLFVWIIYMYISIYKKVKCKLKNQINQPFSLLFHAIFFIGLLVANFEPNYLIGSFQGEVFFWYLIFVLLKFDNYNIDNIDSTRTTSVI